MVKQKLIWSSKYIIYAVLLLLLYVLQTTPGFMSIFGIRPILIVPFVICIAMLESELVGVAYGCAAGLLWDTSLGKLFGFNGLMVLLACFLVKMLTTYIIRVNKMSLFIVSLVTMTVVLSLDFVVYYGMWTDRFSGSSSIYFGLFLPVALYSALLAPILFIAVQRIYNEYEKLHEQE